MKIYEIGTGYTSIPAKVPAATESIVEELTKAFMKSQIDVEILDVSDADRTAHKLPITEVRVPSFFTKSDVSLGVVHKIKRVVYSVALASKLKKILKKSDEKLVLHFHNQYNQFFFIKLVSKRLREKAFIAYTNHNGMWSLPWEQAESVIRKRYFQEITAMENSDLVFALNSKMRDNIVANLNVDRDKVILINNGVNTDLYSPMEPSEIEAVKAEYGLTGKKVILQVGSVYENKGQDRSLRMLAPVLKKNEDLVFAYVGGVVSEEYHTQVKDTAKTLGIENQTVYLGSVTPGKDMNRLYNMAEATIFVSQYESFGLVCIESLSAGVPVLICSDSLLDFGDGCIICSPDTIENSISEDVLTDNSEYKNLCQASRNNAVNNFSWSRISQDYYSAFTK